jgi:hypothetical protein
MHLLDSDKFSSRNEIGLQKNILGPFDCLDIPQNLNDVIESVCIDSQCLDTDMMRLYIASSKGLIIRVKISVSPPLLKYRHITNRNYNISHLALINNGSSTNFAIFGKGCDGEVLLVNIFSIFRNMMILQN